MIYWVYTYVYIFKFLAFRSCKQFIGAWSFAPANGVNVKEPTNCDDPSQ